MIESGTTTGPVFTRDKDGFVQTRPFEWTPEPQPWEWPVEDRARSYTGPAPLRDPMEVSR